MTLIAAFLVFGSWQLRRHAERLDRNVVVEARLRAPAVELEAALSAAAREAAVAGVDPRAYRRVVVHGRFDAAHEVLRRPVARDGVPGYHVVTPLLLDDPAALLVERGWVPQELDTVPVREAPPPGGEVRVEGWLFPTERPPTGGLAWLAPRDPPEGPLVTVAYLDPERLAPQLPYPLQDVYLLLDAPPRPPGDRRLPLPPPPPSLDPGPHLGYAVQWFAFAVIGVVGYAALLRSAVRGESAPAPRR